MVQCLTFIYIGRSYISFGKYSKILKCYLHIYRSFIYIVLKIWDVPRRRRGEKLGFCMKKSEIFENSEILPSYMNSPTSSRTKTDISEKKNFFFQKKVRGHNFLLRQYFSMRFFAKNIYVVWKPRIRASSWISRPEKIFIDTNPKNPTKSRKSGIFEISWDF